MEFEEWRQGLHDDIKDLKENKSLYFWRLVAYLFWYLMHYVAWTPFLSWIEVLLLRIGVVGSIALASGYLLSKLMPKHFGLFFSGGIISELEKKTDLIRIASLYALFFGVFYLLERLVKGVYESLKYLYAKWSTPT